jgi:hypothetical protein
MKLQCIAGTRLVAAVLTGLFLPALAVASITDFNTWDPVEDPYHENFTGSVDSASQITLRATAGPIPSGTDIGYQSVNGDAVADSTAGWAFDQSSDFSVSVDFSVFFEDPEGGFSLGMGIGVDRHGTDSAGILLASQNGGLLTFGGASRVNDAPHSLIGLGFGQSTGRFLVSYEAASGDVVLGVSTDGDNTAEASGTFDGIQNLWDDQPLLVAVFARGDNGISNWSSGTAEVVFSNFNVIAGEPFEIAASSTVPEPSSIWTMFGVFLGMVGCVVRFRRRSN